MSATQLYPHTIGSKVTQVSYTVGSTTTTEPLESALDSIINYCGPEEKTSENFKATKTIGGIIASKTDLGDKTALEILDILLNPTYASIYKQPSFNVDCNNKLKSSGLLFTLCIGVKPNITFSVNSYPRIRDWLDSSLLFGWSLNGTLSDYLLNINAAFNAESTETTDAHSFPIKFKGSSATTNVNSKNVASSKLASEANTLEAAITEDSGKLSECHPVDFSETLTIKCTWIQPKVLAFTGSDITSPASWTSYYDSGDKINLKVHDGYLWMAFPAALAGQRLTGFAQDSSADPKYVAAFPFEQVSTISGLKVLNNLLCLVANTGTITNNNYLLPATSDSEATTVATYYVYKFKSSSGTLSVNEWKFKI